jgi:hypothetical protein
MKKPYISYHRQGSNTPAAEGQRLQETCGIHAQEIMNVYGHELKNAATRKQYIDSMTRTATLMGAVDYVPPSMPARFQEALDLLAQAVQQDEAEAQALQADFRERMLQLNIEGTASSIGSAGSVGSPIDIANWNWHWHAGPEVVPSRIFGGHDSHQGMDASASHDYESLDSSNQPYLDAQQSLVETFSAHLKLDDDCLDSTDPTETSTSMPPDDAADPDGDFCLGI